MTITHEMQRKLTQALSPTELMIEDESGQHVGHAGARPEGETHFRLRIVSAAFKGLSRIERSRLVHELLSEELRGRVHALSIEARTPDEAAPPNH